MLRHPVFARLGSFCLASFPPRRVSVGAKVYRRKRAELWNRNRQPLPKTFGCEHTGDHGLQRSIQTTGTTYRL
ncbi:hypothetical protein GGR56DRAFT_417726 [Xylariaceae sp. FL0804]|nr:hypothetical protein GGR56DRAFT_417726 [Xylariaceae sp. FL0804]